MKSTIARLAQRKIETMTTAVVASVSAFGAFHRSDLVAPSAQAPQAPQAQQARAQQPAPVLRYITAVTYKKDPSRARRSPVATARMTLGLPNLDHPRVDSWIKRFTTDQRKSFATQLARMAKYSGMIGGKLIDKDMPTGLIYLAMIESGFNPKARSPVKASGLWQFMAPTAKQFGLTVNHRVDQRNDPARSTDAALKYLAQLRNQFGSWYLAAAAYNSGQGTVARALKNVTGQTKGTDADYYRIAHRLPAETRDYVPKLIAAARIGANPTRYGFRAN